jgi:hypothetical protein
MKTEKPRYEDLLDMPRNRLMVLFVAVAISGCAARGTSSVPVDEAKPSLTTSQRESWQLMIGRWYGDQPLKEGGRKQWVATRAADGTYRIDFVHTTADGAVNKSSEVGHWGVSGPVYFSSFRGWIEANMFRRADPTDPYNYDAYRITRIDANVFEYEHFTTRERFSVRRVAADFEIPQ